MGRKHDLWWHRNGPPPRHDPVAFIIAGILAIAALTMFQAVVHPAGYLMVGVIGLAAAFHLCDGIFGRKPPDRDLHERWRESGRLRYPDLVREEAERQQDTEEAG